jgi:hypothetical protein
MRWKRALEVLTEYHTHAQVGEMVGAAENSVSGWVSGRHEPGPDRKRKLVTEADSRYPKEMEAETDGEQ